MKWLRENLVFRFDYLMCDLTYRMWDFWADRCRGHYTLEERITRNKKEER